MDISRYRSCRFIAFAFTMCGLCMNHARAGQIYVTSFGSPNGALGKYDTSAGGGPVAGWSNLTVPSPTAVAVDDAGFVYLASLNNNTIRKYTSTGTQVGGWEITGLAGPQGIAINNSTGRLYVAQGTSGLVASYNLSNASLVNSSLLGSAIGNPYSVLVDSAGFVFVTAQSTGVIYKVDGTSGTTAAGWTNPTGFNSPTGLALDSSGNLYVSSYGGGFVSKFNGTSGGALAFTSPQWNGSFMPGPQGLAIDGDDNLYVAFASSTDAVGKYSLANSLPAPGWNFPTGLSNGVQLALVPEPATCVMALAGLAYGGVSMLRRRRNRRHTKSGRCPAATHTVLIIAIGMVCLSMRTADAEPSLADITWGAATNITGDSDVDTTGTLVYAYNFGSSSSATVRTINGVTFQPFVVPNTFSNSATTGSVTITESSGYLSSDLDVGSGTTAPFSTLSPDYRSVLSSEVYSSNFANIRVDLGGLTPGTEYLLQWWTNDSAMTPYIPGFPRYLFENTFSSGSVGSVTLDSNTTNVIGGLGQYVIGTFTASDTTASFTLTGSGTGIDQLPLLNALQVRAVPEPSTYAMALAGLAYGGYSLFHRRKRA